MPRMMRALLRHATLLRATLMIIVDTPPLPYAAARHTPPCYDVVADADVAFI